MPRIALRMSSVWPRQFINKVKLKCKRAIWKRPLSISCESVVWLRNPKFELPLRSTRRPRIWKWKPGIEQSRCWPVLSENFPAMNISIRRLSNWPCPMKRPKTGTTPRSCINKLPIAKKIPKHSARYCGKPLNCMKNHSTPIKRWKFMLFMLASTRNRLSKPWKQGKNWRILMASNIKPKNAIVG